MKNMSFLERKNLFVLAHGEQAPSDEEWNEYIAALRKHADHISSMRVLVVSQGGGPSMGQRKKLKDVFGSTPLPTAVITSSVIARTIVSIIRLTSPEIAAFAPDQRREAYAQLGFQPADAVWLDERMAYLERELRGSA